MLRVARRWVLESKMLFAILGVGISLAFLNHRSERKIMSAIDNLKREVAETTQQNALVVDLVRSLRSDMSSMADVVTKLREDLAEAIADNGSEAEFEELAAQLDTSQRAISDMLAGTPGEPTNPTGPTGPTSEPEAPTGPTSEPEGPTDSEGPTGEPEGPTSEPEVPTGPTGEPEAPTGEPEGPTTEPEAPTGPTAEEGQPADQR